MSGDESSPLESPLVDWVLAMAPRTGLDRLQNNVTSRYTSVDDTSLIRLPDEKEALQRLFLSLTLQLSVESPSAVEKAIDKHLELRNKEDEDHPDPAVKAWHKVRCNSPFLLDHLVILLL
jgi:hypothetical protein